MGNKINPIIFNFLKNNNNFSFWFSEKYFYSQNILEDKKIRDIIKKFFNFKKTLYLYEISHIEIKKKNNLIKIKIYIGINKSLINNLLNKLNKLRNIILLKLNYINNNIEILKIKNIYLYPNILAKFIIKKLKNKVSLNKIFQKIIILTDNTYLIKKFKIKITGKINSKKITYNEYINENFSIFYKKINYALFKVKTIYGIFSIKIFINF